MKIRLSDWSGAGLVVDKLRIVGIDNPNSILEFEAEQTTHKDAGNIITDVDASGQKAVKLDKVGVYTWWILPKYEPNMITISGHVTNNGGKGLPDVKMNLCNGKTAFDCILNCSFKLTIL